jgi:hypothetical protein
MNDVKNLAAVIGFHNQLHTAKSVLVDDEHKTCRRIDFITILARARATWVTSGRVELEGKA